MAEKEGSCVADPAKAGASLKSLGTVPRCPEPPEMLTASNTMPICQLPQGTQTLQKLTIPAPAFALD